MQAEVGSFLALLARGVLVLISNPSPGTAPGGADLGEAIKLVQMAQQEGFHLLARGSLGFSIQGAAKAILLALRSPTFHLACAPHAIFGDHNLLDQTLLIPWTQPYTRPGAHLCQPPDLLP